MDKQAKEGSMALLSLLLSQGGIPTLIALD
jgi:hypothetical protein